jgi:hypothetical protein
VIKICLAKRTKLWLISASARDERIGIETGAYLNDPILIDVVEHLVHDRRDNLFRTTGDGQGDGGSVEVARKNLSGENGLFLEEIPFTFVLDERNEVSDETGDNQHDEWDL